jgi:haloalkane dehalogenase
MLAGDVHGVRPAWVDDTLFPFTSRFADIDGNLVHYVDEGDGRPIVFLHGNPTWSFVYRDVIAALRGSYRCVALDYPGFGLSQAREGYGSLPEEHAQAVVGFLDAADLDDVTLVVHDWGGPIGMWAALARPARISRLVIGNTWAWPVNGDRHFEVFSALMGGPPGRWLIERANLFVRVMIPRGHRLRKVSAAEMMHYRAALDTAARRRGSAIFPRQIIAGHAFLSGVAARLGELADRPALIIWGDADIAFRDTELHRWEALLSDHETVVVFGAGHYVQSDAAAVFAQVLDGWMAARAGGGSP